MPRWTRFRRLFGLEPAADVEAELRFHVEMRVRELVDRRFYRSRYDAQRTLEAFAGRLRDEVDIEAVGRALTEASGRAVQPAAVGIWLRRSTP